MLKVDLHSHSYASDGTLSPSDLLLRAGKQKLDILALTDHDTTEGLEEAADAAKTHRIKLIKGVEISCIWNKSTIHVVALGIDKSSFTLQKLLTKMYAAREQRAKKIGDKLEKQGITDAYQKARSMCKDGLLTRTHYARMLVDNNHAKDMKQSFKKYLTKGKPGFVKGKWAELKDVIKVIQAAGGVPIIAHPLRYKMTNTKLNTLFSEFKNFGGTGIEVVNAGNNPDKTKFLARLCNEYDFFASQGSDFHSPGGFIELGKIPPLPNSCRPIWNQL